MSSSNGDSLTTVVIPPKTDHTHTVIMLHGYGDNAENFAALPTYCTDKNKKSLVEAFPSFRWVMADARDTLGFGKHWFSLTLEVLDKTNDIQNREIIESTALLKKLVHAEAALLHDQYNHIFLAGFSQGGAMSLYTYANLDIPSTIPAEKRRLAGVLSLSSWMPLHAPSLKELRKVFSMEKLDDDEAVLQTPFRCVSNADDPLVQKHATKRAVDTLTEYGVKKVDWKLFPYGGHSLGSPEYIQEIFNFFNENKDL